MTPNNLRIASPDTARLSAYASPADSLATTDAENHVNTGLNGAYESEAGALGSFWKKWAFKLAKAIVKQFDLGSRSYRHKSHLNTFSNTSFSQQEG